MGNIRIQFESEDGMTLGTSPHPLGAALDVSAGAEARAHVSHARATLAAAAWRGRDLLAQGIRFLKTHRVATLRVLAAIYLAALAAVVASTWGMTGPGESLHMGQVHVAFLMLAGAGMAVASLNSRLLFPDPQLAAPPVPPRSDLTGLGDLLAQMSHELRTPLNAVIGFSEVMRHELHGPLNERYQEYAIHICESGGRMLKSSQDALAVAEAMTVLLAKTPHLPKERVEAAVVLDEAWRAVGGTGMDNVGCAAACCLIVERRATVQALEHILREAIARAAGASGVEALTRVEANGHSLRIRAQGTGAGASTPGAAGASVYPVAGNGGLNVLLARLLIEAQGGRLTCSVEPDGAWCAELFFPNTR